MWTVPTTSTLIRKAKAELRPARLFKDALWGGCPAHVQGGEGVLGQVEGEQVFTLAWTSGSWQ